MDDDFINLVTALVTVFSVALCAIAVIAGAYIGWIYSKRKEEAPFLTLLVRISVRVAIGAVIVLGYIAWAFTFGGLGKPWGGVVIAAPFWLMLSVPIQVALQWFRERRIYGRKS